MYELFIVRSKTPRGLGDAEKARVAAFNSLFFFLTLKPEEERRNLHLRHDLFNFFHNNRPKI